MQMENYIITAEGQPMSFEIFAPDAKAALDTFKVLHRLIGGPYAPIMDRFTATVNPEPLNMGFFCLN